MNINQTEKLLSEGAINTIKNKKHKKQILAFSRFITSLYPLLEKKSNNIDLEKIPHIGESHCFSFAHKTISISSQLKINKSLIEDPLSNVENLENLNE